MAGAEGYFVIVADTEAGTYRVAELLAQSFARAWTDYPSERRELHYRFAGRAVRANIVGSRLASHLHQPLAHLAAVSSDRAETVLRIDLWDEHATHTPCPTGDTLSAPAARMSNGLLCYSEDGHIARFAAPGADTVYVRDTGHIIGWRGVAGGLSFFERRRPLPVILPMWYFDQGIYPTHAAMVARHGRGVLLAGPSGAGKSTAGLACLAAGFDHLGDDEIGLELLTNGSFVGHNLFSTTHLYPEQLEHVQPLALHALPSTDPAETKSLVHLADIVPDRVGHSAAIRAIALPRVVDAPTSRILPAKTGEALRVIGSSTLLQTAPGVGEPGLRRLAQLVRRVPSYWLEMGRDRQSIAICLDELVDTLA